MKSIIYSLSIVCTSILVSCSSTPPPTTTTIITPAPVPAKAEPTKANTDHTEISVDKNGVSYSKKAGDAATDVTIKKDEKTVIIKK